MNECYFIKARMARKGWDVEERITKDGFGSNAGYSIYFSRYDWHGKFTPSITGKPVMLHAHTDKMTLSSIRKLVSNLAEKADRAWKDFPTSIPCMDSNGEVVEELMFRPFEDGRDVAKKGE